MFKSLNKNVFITIVCSLLVLKIVLAPKLCIDSALLGANLFINKVFPSLFPFLVITSMMMSYDGVNIYSRFLGKFLCKPLRLPLECTFVLVVSVLCGYPLGAKYACELYEKKVISFKTCERLVNIASNASPLFIIGSVGTSMLKNSYIGYLLLLCNCASCFVMGIMLPSENISVGSRMEEIKNIPNKNVGNIIKDSIENSIKISLSIGGYVILFSVITNIIKSNIIFDIAVNKITHIFNVESNLVQGVFLGSIEMTNGCYLISNTTLDMSIKFIIISFFLGFSGFSIISQVYSFTYKYNLSMKKYIIRKFIQGIIGAIIAYAVYKIPFFNLSIHTFNNASNYNLSLNLIFIVSLILCIVPFLLYKTRKLFHAS